MDDMDQTQPPAPAPVSIVIHLAERAGLSVRELAVRAGMKERTLHSRLARGGSFRMSEAFRLAGALGVSAADVFNDEHLLVH